MAQEHGGAGPGDQEPGSARSEVPEMSDSPEMWGNNGLVGDGRYRLTHLLGRGGMAEVFAAEDVRLGRPVAVKLLRADLAEDATSKARFTREAQSVAGLNHHAVVAVYDSGEEFMRLGTAGRGSMVPFIVMELVHGHTIRELLLNAEAPPAEQALIITSGVLEALAYSHQHGIVHRDIKPANVIITDTGTVKVMDFGIARALHGASQTMTQTGMVMGTPQYLSPEQALGKTVDTRSDLYAIGCLLYELLALRPPFVGETPLSVVYQHVQDTPRLASEVSEGAPPELDGLVMRALAKDPEDRFQTAEEMRGVAQYALRMLEEHGSHTGGLWHTGPVSQGPGAPAPPGAPGAGTPGEATATTSQFAAPMLLGNPGGDGAGAGHGGHRGRGGGSGRRRGRLVLVALAAVVAIGSGVLVAANFGGDSEGGNNTRNTEHSRDTSGGETSGQDSEGSDGDAPPPADEDYEEVPTENTDDDDYVPSEDPTTEDEPEPEPTTPTESPTEEPEPTTPDETEPTTPTESETEAEPTPTESETEVEPTPTESEVEPTPTEGEDAGSSGGETTP